MSNNPGAFKKGHAKLGGRKKGGTNIVSREVRNVLTPIISAYVSGEGIGQADENGRKKTLEDDLSVMDPAERARIVTNLVPFVMPKLAAVEVKDKSEQPSFRDELAALEAD